MTFIENRRLKDREGSNDATGSLRTLLSEMRGQGKTKMCRRKATLSYAVQRLHRGSERCCDALNAAWPGAKRAQDAICHAHCAF